MIKFAKQLSAVSGHDWSQIEVQRDHIFNDQVAQMLTKLLLRRTPTSLL